MNTNQKPAVKRKRSSSTKNDCKAVIKTKKRCSNNENKKSVSEVYESDKISANELHESKDIYAPFTDTNLPINHFPGPSLKVKFMLDEENQFEKNAFEKDNNIDYHSKVENSLFSSKTAKSLIVKEDEELNKEEIEENLIKNTSTSDFTSKKEVRFKLDCKSSDESQFKKDSNIDCHSKDENFLFNSETVKSLEVTEDRELNKEKIGENLIKNTSTSDYTPKKEVRFKLDFKSSDENQSEEGSNIDCHSKGDILLFNSKTIKSVEVKEDGELKEKIEGNLMQNTSTSDFTAENPPDSEDEIAVLSENEPNYFVEDFPPNPIISNKLKDLEDMIYPKFEDSLDSEDEIANPNENTQNNLVKPFEVYPNTALVEEIKNFVTELGFNEDLIVSKSESDSEEEIAQLFENEQNDFSFSKFNKTKKSFSITHNKSSPKVESPVPFRGGMFVIKPYYKPFRERSFNFAEKNMPAKKPPETYEKFDAVDLMPVYIPENLNLIRGWQNQESFSKDHSWFPWISNSSYPKETAHDCTNTKSDSEKFNYKDVLNNILPEGHPWFSSISQSSCPEEIAHDCTSTKSDSEKINFNDVLNNVPPEEKSPEKEAKSSKKGHSKRRLKKRNHTRKEASKKEKNVEKFEIMVRIALYRLNRVPPPAK